MSRQQDRCQQFFILWGTKTKRIVRRTTSYDKPAVRRSGAAYVNRKRKKKIRLYY